MRTILVALDASDRAPAVLAAALQFATLSSSQLVVFRAVAVPPELPRSMLATPGASIEDVLLANARADLLRLVRDVPPDRLAKVTTELATAWDGICRAAKTEAVDLVVIGSHGYGGLDRVLGTTAAKVVNHIDRNVLVVRAHTDSASKA